MKTGEKVIQQNPDRKEFREVKDSSGAMPLKVSQDSPCIRAVRFGLRSSVHQSTWRPSSPSTLLFILLACVSHWEVYPWIWGLFLSVQ